MISFDPFDIWSTDKLGALKARWYKGHQTALFPLGLVYLMDLAAPTALRRILGVKQSEFAHVLAILQGTEFATNDLEFVERVSDLQMRNGWGLGFKWFSANGNYPCDIPYITNTPYVMRALLNVSQASTAKPKAKVLFDESWDFLQSLQSLHESAHSLALSYAPVKEPNIVINANTYAAYAYAMHAKYGLPERQNEAKQIAMKLIRFVVEQQYEDGRWYYLAERGRLDMIDCFHSCFVVRNLMLTRDLIPEISELMPLDKTIDLGWAYIKSAFYDPNSRLVKRYSVISRFDPFRYDLYDQAEYLGLLIDFGELNDARELSAAVKKRFMHNSDWFCRIDRLNRRWGRNFLRWGIVQFWYHETRLNELLD